MSVTLIEKLSYYVQLIIYFYIFLTEHEKFKLCDRTPHERANTSIVLQWEKTENFKCNESFTYEFQCGKSVTFITDFFVVEIVLDIIFMLFLCCLSLVCLK